MKKFLSLILTIFIILEGIPMYTLAVTYSGVGIHSFFLDFESAEKPDILSSGELVSSSAEPEILIPSNGDRVYSIAAVDVGGTTQNSGELIDIKNTLGTDFEAGDTMIIEADYYSNANTVKSCWGFSLTDGPVGNDLRAPLIWWTAKVQTGMKKFILNGSDWHPNLNEWNSDTNEWLGATAGWYNIKTKIYFAKNSEETSYREVCFKAPGDTDYTYLTCDGTDRKLEFPGGDKGRLDNRRYLALFGTNIEDKNYVDNLRVVIIKKSFADSANSATDVNGMQSVLSAYSKSGQYGFNKDFNTLHKAYRDYIADNMLNRTFANDTEAIAAYNSLSDDNLFAQNYLSLHLSNYTISAPGGNTASSLKATLTKSTDANTVYDAKWSCTPQNSGVSVLPNGDISISSAAVPATYTVSAKVGEYSTSKQLTVAPFQYELYISGSDAVKIPYTGTVSADYSAQDNLDGTNLPVTWHLDGANGISVTNTGTLNVTPEAQPGLYTLRAEYNSDSAAFGINLYSGNYELNIEGSDLLSAYSNKAASTALSLKVRDKDTSAVVYIPTVSDAVWSIVNPSENSTINNGNFKCTYGAPATYTIKAVYDSMEAYFDISVQDNSYKISGADNIIKPLGNILTKSSYSLSDKNGTAVLNPVWTASGAQFKDGGLIVSKYTASPVELSAESDGGIAKKSIKITDGLYYDFENYTSGDSITATGYGVIKKGNTGKGVYFGYTGDNTNDRYTIPIGISGEYSDEIHIRYDMQATPGSYRLPVFTNSASSWINESRYTVSDNGDGSFKYTFNMQKYLGDTASFANTEINVESDSWVSVDYAFNSADVSYDLYLNNKLALGNLKLKDDQGGAFSIKNMIFTGKYERGGYDNIMTYSGNLYPREIVFVADKTLSTSANGGSRVLVSRVYEDGELCTDMPIEWKITGFSPDYSGNTEDVYISKGTLHAKKALGGSVFVRGYLSDKVTQSEEIEIKLQSAVAAVDTSGTVSIKGAPGVSYTVELYAPSDGDFISSCLEYKNVAETSVPLTADALGMASTTLNLTRDGIYLVKVYSADNSICDSYEIYNNTDILTRPDAAALLSRDNIATYLEKFTDFSSEDIININETYNKLSAAGKNAAVNYCEGDIDRLNFAVALSSLFSGNKAMSDKCAALLKANGYRCDFISMLIADADYKTIAATGLLKTNVTDAIGAVVDKLVLTGINKSSGFPKSAGKYLILMGSTRYINGTNTLKSAIEAAVSKGGWTDIPSLLSAIAAVKEEPTYENPSILAQGGGGGGGGGSFVNISGSENTDTDKNNETNIDETQTNSTYFKDVSPSHWAYSYITELQKRGIASGYMGNFNPENSITRAEYAKLIFEALGFESVSGGSFSDVNPSAWYYKYISALSSYGIITGYMGNFNPDKAITREDAAVIAKRAIDAGSYMLNEGTADFVDSNDISSYALPAVSGLAAAGIITGNDKGLFAPARNITRAESSAIICRILNLTAEVASGE